MTTQSAGLPGSELRLEFLLLLIFVLILILFIIVISVLILVPFLAMVQADVTPAYVSSCLTASPSRRPEESALERHFFTDVCTD